MISTLERATFDRGSSFVAEGCVLIRGSIRLQEYRVLLAGTSSATSGAWA